MGERETPRRKRFQFHLSTAIVVMTVIGALSYVSMAAIQNSPSILANDEFRYRSYYEVGWPIPSHTAQWDGNGIHVIDLWLPAMLGNLAVNGGLVILAAIASEWLIRRKATPSGARTSGAAPTRNHRGTPR